MIESTGGVNIDQVSLIFLEEHVEVVVASLFGMAKNVNNIETKEKEND